MLKLLGLIALIAIIFGVSFSSAFGILVKAVVIIICVLLFCYLALAHGKTMRKVIGWAIVAFSILVVISGYNQYQNGKNSFQSSYNFCIEWEQEKIYDNNRYYGKIYSQQELDSIAQMCVDRANQSVKNAQESGNNTIILGVIGIIIGGCILPKNSTNQNKQVAPQRQNKNSAQ